MATGAPFAALCITRFVLGDPAHADRAEIRRQPRMDGGTGAVVALATNRGLMLIGEPGTAKSYLSELLAAAVSGDSTLVVQGSAGHHGRRP